MNWIKIQYSFIKIPWRVHKGYTFMYILLRILLGISPFFYIMAYSSFINNVLRLYKGSITYNFLLPSFLQILVLSLFKYFSGNLIGYTSMKLQTKLFLVLKIESIEKISKLKYELIENDESWDLIHRTIKDMPDKIRTGFFNLFDLIELAIKVMSIVTIIGAFSLEAAIIVSICFIPIVLVSIHSGENDYDSFVKFEKVQRRLENYKNILISKEYADERKIFNYSFWFTKKWGKCYQKSMELFLKVKKRNYIKVKLTSFIINIIFLGIIGIFVKFTIEGVISFGLFTSSVMQLFNLSSKIAWSLSRILYQVANSGKYMEDYIKFYTLDERLEQISLMELESINCIEFKNVSFKYPGNKKYTLKNVNLKLNSNETYAIVGKNGVGKSTLTKLMLKLYDDYEGKILINGVDLRKISNVSSLFSVMFQDYAKYEISIFENILFDNSENIDVSKVVKLLKYLKFPIDSKLFFNGVHTELGRLTNRNVDISIGQWQKLAMIRAFMQKGQFYILDEPTASLDPVIESNIYNDFMEILNNNPAIIITHRLGAARLTDQIIVMDKGSVIEIGTHDELIMNEGLYKEMYKKQKVWYIDEEKKF